MKYKKTSAKKKIARKRTEWLEIGAREWESLETDESFREGFLLAMNNISLKINAIRQNSNKLYLY